MIKKIWPLVLVILFSLLPLRFVFQGGFFPIHDEAQVIRVNQMAKAISEGQFPVRWVSDLGYGYGYPIFNFYNPLPYYFGGMVDLLGLDALLATKAMFVIGFLLAGVGMYLLANKLFGKFAGTISALFYVYAPYHATQLYVRGSIAEMWAYGIIPFVFWGLLKKNYFITGISLACLISSHNLIAVVILPLFVLVNIIILIVSKKKERISLLYYFITSILIGLGLSAFFWLPAVFEKQYTGVDIMVQEKFNPLKHFVYPQQFFNSIWGYAGSAPGMLDGMSFQIGKIHILVSLLAVILVFYLLGKTKKLSKLAISLLGLLAFSIFMMICLSKPIWEFLPFLNYLQFPWRFLVLTAFSTSLLAGWLIFILEKRKLNKVFIYTVCALLLGGLLFINLKYFSPQYLYEAREEDLLKEEIVRWDISSASDEYLPAGLDKPKGKEFLFKDKYLLYEGGEIKENKRTSTLYDLAISSPKQNILTINNAYFPGWRAWIDGKSEKIDKSNYLINIKIPEGEHEVLVKLKNTPIRIIANTISLIAFLILLYFLIKTSQKHSTPRHLGGKA